MDDYLKQAPTTVLSLLDGKIILKDFLYIYSCSLNLLNVSVKTIL